MTVTPYSAHNLLVTTTTTPATICTVVIGAPMIRCGAPAVATFTGATGTVYAECADHAAPAIVAPVITIGARVRVRHVGVVKTGVVEKIGPARITVRVPVYVGTRKATTKLIVVPAGDVTL